jgi:hypothetical protein
MPNQKITPEQMNTLFCSPPFLRKVKESGKPSAQVYLDATDEEFAMWLQEGYAMQKKIPQLTKGDALRQDDPVLRIKWIVANALVWPLAVFLGESLGPTTLGHEEAVVFWGVSLMGVGFLSGVLQFLVLRPFGLVSWSWPVMSAVGWGIGAPIGMLGAIALVDEIPALAGGVVAAALFWGIGGGVAGTLQWLSLRRGIYGAYRWIFISAASWAIAGFAARTVTGKLTGAVFGIISAIWLPSLLAGRPRSRVGAARD